MAIQKEIKHDQGTTFHLNIVYKDSDGEPVDLTGHRVTLDVYGNTTFRYEGVVDTEGNIAFKVEDEVTARWGSGRLNYVVDHHTPNGDRHRMYQGILDIKGVR